VTGVVIAQVNESPPAEPVAAGALASLATSDPTRRPARRQGALSSVVAQSAAVLLDQGLSSATSFLIALLVARHCDKAEYGLYVLGFSLLVTLQFALRSVISVPFTVNCPRVSPRDLEGYLGSTLVHQLVGSALAATGLALAAGVLYLLRHDSGMAGVLLALSVASAAVLLRDFVRTTYLAFLRVWANLVLGVLSSTLTLALVLWAYWTDGLSASRAYLLTAIGAGLPAATGLVLVSRRLAVVKARVFGDLKRNWDFGKWTLASVIANSLGMRAMPWLVLIWCGSQAVGAFGAQTAIAGLVNPVIIGLASYLTPKLANHAQAEGLASAWRMGMRIVRGSLVAAAVYVAIMVAWGNDLLGLCYSPKYQGLPVEMALLAAAVTMEALTVPLRSLLRVMDRPRTEFWASVVALGVTLVVGAFLIPSAGLVGAAGALASRS
jgi:O-antigen/teichoic acid export membrane protein